MSPAQAVGRRAGAMCVAAAAMLIAAPAFAFCVVNNTGRPVDIQAGGQPMPVHAHYGLKPGERHCYLPRKPEGILVEIFDAPQAAPRRLKCRLSVPAKEAEIDVAQNCRVRID